MHSFKKIAIPYFLFSINTTFNYKNCSACKICTKCNLIIVSENIYFEDNYIINNDWFFINKKEVFESVITLEKLNLTCDEIIIKNIIE